MQLRLESEGETCAYAARLAESLEPGSVVTLSGDLGAGKSVFARALMRSLGVTDEAMPSPTFALIQTYDGRQCKIAHMDWYRLEDSDEIELLGIREYFTPPWISIIEWPERAPKLIPDKAVQLRLQAVANDLNARVLETV